MCVQRLNMSHPPAIEIEALKEALNVKGEYERTDSFKRSVLDIAIKQINKHTDLKVAYKQVKTGRVITHFQLEVSMKPEHRPKPKQRGLNEQTLAELARPGERREDAFGRLKNGQAKRRSKRPEQLSILDQLEPLPRNAEDPKVQESIKETRKAVAALKNGPRKKPEKAD